MNTLNSVFYCHCQSVTTLSAKPQTFSVTVPCLPCLQLGTHYYLNYISGFQEKSVLPFEKNEIFFKTSFPTTKIYDDGLHYVTKIMKVDL